MRKILTTVLLSALVGLSGPTVAPAQNMQLEIGPDGLRLRDRCDPRREDCRDRRGPERRPRICTDDDAYDKAARMGVRGIRFEQAGRRTVTIQGRMRGDRVRITFGRDRGCPVLDRDFLR